MNTDKYRVVKVLEKDYTAVMGLEPFVVVWGAEGWVIWCKVLVKTRVSKVKKGKNG